MIYTKFKNFNDFIAEEEDSDFLQFDEVQFLVYQKLEELTEDEQRQLTEKQTLQELINQKPAEMAMLIKTWLAEDE